MLSDDIAWFESQRVNLARQYNGQWLLVKNQKVIGAFPDYGSAYNTGVSMFGKDPFLVQQALAQAPVQNILGGRIRMLGQVRLAQAGAANPVAAEIAWFEQNRAQLAQQYQGQWLLVKGSAVIGAFPDYDSAYHAGVAKFGTQPFLVQQAVAAKKPEKILGRGIPTIRLGQQQYGAPATPAQQLRETGAIVSVVIANPAALTGQGAANKPQTVKAMIDTGASISTVSPAVAAAAGLQATGSVPLGGVGGMQDAPLYSVSFAVPEYGVSVDPIQIAGTQIPAQGFEVLLGRDLLQALRLDYHGASGSFSLTQETATPSTSSPGVPGPAGVPAKGMSTGTILLIAAGVAAVGVGSYLLFD